MLGLLAPNFAADGLAALHLIAMPLADCKRKIAVLAWCPERYPTLKLHGPSNKSPTIPCLLRGALATLVDEPEAAVKPACNSLRALFAGPSSCGG